MWDGRASLITTVDPAKSAIWKSPVAGRVAARGVNLDGDDQADRKAHGGSDKSVYAYGELAGMGATFSRENESSPRSLGYSWMLLIFTR